MEVDWNHSKRIYLLCYKKAKKQIKHNILRITLKENKQTNKTFLRITLKKRANKTQHFKDNAEIKTPAHATIHTPQKCKHTIPEIAMYGVSSLM